MAKVKEKEEKNKGKKKSKEKGINLFLLIPHSVGYRDRRDDWRDIGNQSLPSRRQNRCAENESKRHCF